VRRPSSAARRKDEVRKEESKLKIKNNTATSSLAPLRRRGEEKERGWRGEEKNRVEGMSTGRMATPRCLAAVGSTRRGDKNQQKKKGGKKLALNSEPLANPSQLKADQEGVKKKRRKAYKFLSSPASAEGKRGKRLRGVGRRRGEGGRRLRIARGDL